MAECLKSMYDISKIRYIQEMLGHSSINVTEIYTHVAVAGRRDILVAKHPRKDFHI